MGAGRSPAFEPVPPRLKELVEPARLVAVV